MNLKRWFRLEKLQGEPIQAGNVTVTPFSRQLSLGLPAGFAARRGLAFIYQQPAGVRIERDGQVSKVPIYDVQRMMIASMLLITLVCVIFTHFNAHQENTNE